MQGDQLSEEARRVGSDIGMEQPLVNAVRCLAAYEVDVERAQELLSGKELSAGRQFELTDLIDSNSQNAETYRALLTDIGEHLAQCGEGPHTDLGLLLTRVMRVRLDSAELGWSNVESRYGLTRQS